MIAVLANESLSARSCAYLLFSSYNNVDPPLRDRVLPARRGARISLRISYRSNEDAPHDTVSNDIVARCHSVSVVRNVFSSCSLSLSLLLTFFFHGSKRNVDENSYALSCEANEQKTGLELCALSTWAKLSLSLSLDMAPNSKRGRNVCLLCCCAVRCCRRRSRAHSPSHM